MRRGTLCGAATGDEVHDHRDDREQKQQVDEEAGDVHDGETADPENDENDSENEEHGNLLSEGLVRALCLNRRGLGERRVQAMREVNC